MVVGRVYVGGNGWHTDNLLLLQFNCKLAGTLILMQPKVQDEWAVGVVDKMYFGHKVHFWMELL